MSSIVSNRDYQRISLDELNSTGEMAKQWPIRIHRSGSTSTPLTTPKSTIHSNIHDSNNSPSLKSDQIEEFRRDEFHQIEREEEQKEDSKSSVTNG